MTFADYPALDAVYEHDLHQRRLGSLWGLVGEDQTVLSVGCNAAYDSRFAPEGCHLYGVDLSWTALASARRRTDGVCIGRAAALPFRSRSVDVVMLGNVLEYVLEPEAVVREARRVARRKLIGSTPHEDGYWGRSWFEDGQPVKDPDQGRELPRRYLTEADLAYYGLAVRDVVYADNTKKPAYWIFEALW